MVEPVASKGRSRRWRRGVSVVLTSTLASGLLLLLLLLVILYTEGGSRILVRQIIEDYNRQIPGHLSVGAIEGTLGDRLTLRHVRGVDRRGRALVAVHTVDLVLSLEELMTGHLNLFRLVFFGPTVHLRGDNQEYRDTIL